MSDTDTTVADVETVVADTTPDTTADQVAESAQEGVLGDGQVRDIEAARKMIEDGLGAPEPEVPPDGKSAEEAAPPKAETGPVQEAPPKDAKTKATEERLRKDADLHRRKVELAAKEERYAKMEALAAKVKTGDADPNDLLAELGLTYRDTVEAGLKSGKGKDPNTVEAMQERLTALETQIKEKEVALQTQEFESKRAHAERSILTSIDAELRASGDKYDAILAYDAQGEVLAELQRHLNETATEFDAHGRPVDGEVLTLAEAADKVEARLVEERIQRSLKTKYARQHASSTPTGTVGTKQAAANGSRTLTNGHGAPSAPTPANDGGARRFDTTEEARKYLEALMGS